MSATTALDEARAARILQASDWFVRVSEDELSEPELAEWLQWCTDSENLREFQRIRATSDGFDQIREQASAMLDALMLDAPSVSSAREPVEKTSLTQRSSSHLRWAMAAAFALCVAGGIWLVRNSEWFGPPPSVIASQDAIRSALLPDGSTLVLAPRTRLTFAFQGSRRQLSLAQGEAYFNVHHDRTKPFVVGAGPLSVTAVGTAFDVRMENERIVTLVQEGTVMVNIADAALGAPARLQVSAGYEVTYDVAQRSAAVSVVDTNRALAWREGRLQFLDEPLRTVVSEVSRYSSKRIQLGDPTLGELRFTGTVFVESLDDWVGALAGSFPVRGTRADDSSIILLPAASTGSPLPVK